MKRVCIFCGSSNGTHDGYRDAARALGEALARRGYTLVYGGGKVGLMGAVADAALTARGRVIGVMPTALVLKEIAHMGLSEFHEVESMHQRKAKMADLADAFVALPGGFGTLDEFCEVLTWAQLGYHAKPCAMLNTNGFFTPLLAFFDHLSAEGFIRAAHRSLILVEDEPGALLDRLEGHQPVLMDKWLDKKSL